MAENCRPVLLRDEREVCRSVDLERQAAVIRRLGGKPEARTRLVTQLRTQGVALILGNRKRSGTRQLAPIITQEQAARDRQITDTDHVAVADVSSERAGAAQIQFGLEPANGSAAESYRKAHAGIEQQTVVGKIGKAAPVPVPVKPQASRHRFRKSRFDEIA